MSRNALRTALVGIGALAVRLVVLVAAIVVLLAVVAPAIANAYTTWAHNLPVPSTTHSAAPTTRPVP